MPQLQSLPAITPARSDAFAHAALATESITDLHRCAMRILHS